MREVRWQACRATAVFLLIVGLWAALASVARADGDPASDYLITNQVFLTSQGDTVPPAERALVATVRAANHAGFAIRVAVIPTEYDLGSITALWRRPSVYARFLGIELSLAYRGRLLVVMPNGFGFNWPGHSAASVARTLAEVPPGNGGPHLASAAQVVVRRLAAADGVKLAPIRPTATEGPARVAGPDVPVIVGVALGGLAALGILAGLVLRAWRRPRRPRAARPGLGPGPAKLAGPIGLRWQLPAVVLLVAIALGVAIRVVRGGPGSPQIAAASVVTPPAVSWRAGERPAPNFVLRDQAGRPVSLAAYRGHPVIVTFIDPLCRNLCPLEAQVLDQVDRELPAAHRPTILAVSVDVYADTRADMLQDEHEWRLVPQWRWAVGPHAQLASVWKSYEVGVQVVTDRIAHTTIHYITHTEGAYIIDASGHERALFLWPFYPQDIKRELEKLA